MGMCMSFVLLMFLLPMLLITGSNSITSFTALDNGCEDDGECVQGTTPGSSHGFYPQGMEGSAGITCGCNPKSKLIIGFAGGLITLLFTSASFLIYKRYKKLKENELKETYAEQLNELKERHAEQLNQLKKRHARQLQNELMRRHAEQAWVSIGRRVFSWLTTNEGLLHLILAGLGYYIPRAKGFCLLLKSIYASVQQRRERVNLVMC